MALPDFLTLVRLAIEFGGGLLMLVVAMRRRRSASSWRAQALLGGYFIGFGALSIWELSSGGNRITLILAALLGAGALAGVIMILKEFKRGA